MIKLICLLFIIPFSLSTLTLGELPGIELNSPIAFPMEDGVIHLTEKTIDEALRQYNHLLIKFYAEWCGHCLAMKKNFSEAAKDKKVRNIGAHFAEYNLGYYPKLGEELGIRGFPTVIYFKNGTKDKVYEADFKTETIISWVYKNLFTPFELISKKSDVTLKFMLTGESKSIIYYRNRRDYIHLLANYSRKHLDYKIGIIVNRTLVNQVDAYYDSIRFFRHHDMMKHDYRNLSNLTEEFLDDIFYVNSYPQLIEDAKFMAKAIYKNHKSIVMCLRHPSLNQTVDPVFKNASRRFDGLIKFVLDNTTLPYASRLMERMGIQKELDKPSVFILTENLTVVAYRFKGEYTEINLVEFVVHFLNKKLEPDLKSEPIPEKQDAPVFKVVANSFKRDVIDNDKYVLVKFYKPHCPHCVRLAPEYIKAAETLKNEENIRVAEFDVSKNQQIFVKIHGVPTLYLYVPGKKENPIEYSGKRKADDFIQFIRDNMKEK